MLMAAQSVEVKVHPPAGTIILNRPQQCNALTRSMLSALKQALEDLYQERRVRAIIISGAGSAFSSGMDLLEMQTTAEQPDAHTQWGDDAAQFRDVVTTMLQITKPIIAAVNGPAVAGGAGLVLASDLVVACSEAKFGLPEPRRGIVAGIVGPLVAFRVGVGQAARLMLTSMLIEGEEAYRIGLYHEMVAQDHVWARASELAEQCAQGAPQAVQLSKRLVTETLGEHLSAQLSAGAVASATAHTTDAATEGVAAFLEKRDPNW